MKKPSIRALLQRILRILFRPRVAVRVGFSTTKGQATMSQTVSLTANGNAAQHCTVTGSITVNGQPFTAQVGFSTSDQGVASVNQQDATTGIVQGVRDPSGPSTRTCQIIGTASVNGQTVTGTGTVTVVTTADSVVVTLDFGPPQG